MVVENGRGYVPATEHSPNVRNRHHSGRRRLQPGRPRPLRDRRDPRRPEDQLRQVDVGNLDQRLRRPGNGVGRSRQDSAQASQPVRPVQRVGAASHRRRSCCRRVASDAAVESKLGMSLAELKLSVRATNCLESENIHTVRDLVIQHRGPVAGRAQLRRNNAERGPRKARRIGAAAGDAVARRRCRRDLKPRFVRRSPSRPENNLNHRYNSDHETSKNTDERSGRAPSHQRALLKNLASALFLTERDAEYDENKPKVKGRIITTLQKAKEVRPLVEKCITIACRSHSSGALPVSSRPTAARNSAEAGGSGARASGIANGTRRCRRSWRRVAACWNCWAISRPCEFCSRRLRLAIADRPGGYTRVMRLAKPRLGDAGTRADSGIRRRCAIA